MKPHPHAKLMAEYAKDAAETETPWDRWEIRDAGSIDIWAALNSHPSWMPTMQYRRKPRTININGHEVPEPMREVLEIGSKYYLVDMRYLTDFPSVVWEGDGADMDWLENGLCHATKEAAIAHAKALLSFTQTTQNND